MKAGGAGAASLQAIGTVVFDGMLSSTLLAIPFVPVFYVITKRLSELRQKPADKGTSAEGEAVTKKKILAFRFVLMVNRDRHYVSMVLGLRSIAQRSPINSVCP